MTSKRLIYLHIGHGKTGTSAFQSYLAIAKNQIAPEGYYYHAHPSLSKARKLGVTSGNLTTQTPEDRKT